ncbi:hypothetical protein [Streptomyces cyaneus]|uniref:hypothetical protein n=1 Tax=Streptomyces cyaneus TaxID=1904 RepID=UPI000FF8A850|nr:hypothetical protein [Streptomyces cyaneus]
MSLQFHFCNADLDTYRIGERVRWGGNDKGIPGQELVEAIGYQEPCDRCGTDEDREYVLVFEYDVLTGDYRYALPEDIVRLEQRRGAAQSQTSRMALPAYPAEDDADYGRGRDRRPGPVLALVQLCLREGDNSGVPALLPLEVPFSVASRWPDAFGRRIAR